jgi:integrase/recombinase XerD
MASAYSIIRTGNHQTIMQGFSQFLYARKGLGEVTVSNYVSTIRRLSLRIGLLPTTNSVERHITKMRTSGASHAHVVNTSIALERYMEFVGTPIRLGRPKKPKRLVSGTLSEAEVTLMIASSHNLRERAILSLLAYSGLRNKELCRLRIRDIDIANQTVSINATKTMKERHAVLAPACIAVLLDYLRERNGRPQDFLFVTIRKGEPYQPQVLRKLVRADARRAGIERRVWPHLFRHSLATNLLHRGAGLMAIKEQLGHVHIETTMIYIHSAPARMQMEYRMFAPSYL